MIDTIEHSAHLSRKYVNAVLQAVDMLHDVVRHHTWPAVMILLIRYERHENLDTRCDKTLIRIFAFTIWQASASTV